MVANPFFADEKPDYLHVPLRILPALAELGVSEADIDQMMVSNPARYLTRD
jgi:predicted metal-dependent phosphotriesterase family hydrolase